MLQNDLNIKRKGTGKCTDSVRREDNYKGLEQQEDV
jgi:hypothetical protein